jgi:hypothetical protein
MAFFRSRLDVRGFIAGDLQVMKQLVGERRFELPTSWSRTKRATRLRYSPNYQKALCAVQMAQMEQK